MTICDECRNENQGICKITGLVAPNVGNCNYYDNRGDLSRPKFVSIYERLDEHSQTLKEIKAAILGDEYSEGMKDRIDKNTKFRKYAQKALYTATGIVITLAFIYPESVWRLLIKLI